MSKKYDKDELVKLLTGLQDHLSEHTADYPGLAPAVVALARAASDPMTAPKGNAKAKKEPKVKPVTINYEGESLLVKTPWGQAGKALAHTFKVIVGKRSKSINPETGEPFFLSCYDKKAKAFRLPVAKKDEVLKAIAESGLPCEG
jgi:hypothetical protein